MPGKKILWLICSKILLIAVLKLLVFYPNPVLFFKQMGHFKNPEGLFDLSAETLSEIDKDLALFATENPKVEDEVKLIEKYIQKRIRYTNDWDLWLNFDYWPKASEVWTQQKEDCDGQAILAINILRSRGINAELVGNLQHIWVKAGEVEILDPMQESGLSATKKGLEMKAPSFNVFKDTLRFFLPIFPSGRLIFIALMASFIICLPLRSLKPYLLSSLILITGYVFMRLWAAGILKHDVFLFAGSFTQLLGIIFAFRARFKLKATDDVSPSP